MPTLIGQMPFDLAIKPFRRLRHQFIQQRALGGVFADQIHAQQQPFAAPTAVKPDQRRTFDPVHPARLQPAQATRDGRGQAAEIQRVGVLLDDAHGAGRAADGVAGGRRCQARIRPMKLSRMNAAPAEAAAGKRSSTPLKRR